jgi:glycosyltransferase involved in cell wall biosynthesis
MVPFWLTKIGNFNSIIASQEKDFNNKLAINNDICFDTIKSYTRKKSINAAIYLIYNYKKIDILHLYHFTLSTILICVLYRFICIVFCRKYITYVKMDLSENTLKLICNPIYSIFIWLGARLITFASVEFQEDYLELRRRKLFRNILYISNSFSLPDNYDKYSSVVKENIILHVSRAGAYQKNSEELLTILPKLLSNSKWKVYIVGPFTKEFESNLFKLKNTFSFLNEKVFLLGNIESREDIELLYARSKMLILTSRWEGSPLALAEARRWGLKIISTRIKGVVEILRGHSAAFTYDSGDTYTLLKVAMDAVADDTYFESGKFNDERAEYSNVNSWPYNLKLLAKKLSVI